MNQWVSAWTHELEIAELMGLQSVLSDATHTITPELMGAVAIGSRKVPLNCIQ